MVLERRGLKALGVVHHEVAEHILLLLLRPSIFVAKHYLLERS